MISITPLAFDAFQIITDCQQFLEDVFLSTDIVPNNVVNVVHNLPLVIIVTGHTLYCLMVIKHII